MIEPMHTPPGPSNFQMVSQIRTIQRNPLRFLENAAQTYGDIVFFPVGTLPVFFLNHPDYIKHVLQENNNNYSKDTIQYNSLARITGKGLLTNDGDDWLRQRRLSQPAFTKQKILLFGDMIVSTTVEFLSQWENNSVNGQSIDMDREMLRLTLEIVGKSLLGIDLSRDARELTEAVMITLDHIMYGARNTFALPDFIPTPRNRRFKHALQQLDRAVYGIIDKHSQKDVTQEDLLSILMAGRDEGTGQGMSIQQLRDEVITILVAGHETVASALTWTWYLLSNNPFVYEQAVSELDRVLQGRLPTIADLSQLVYIRMIFDEALRLYPPAWLITRKAIGDDEIDHYKIPMNSLIITSPYTIQHHAGFWDKPYEFNPQNFSPEKPIRHLRYAYIPFGGGPRLCIGNNFALVEAQLILSIVLQRYRFDLIPNHPIEMEPLVTLRPKYGMPMILQRRSSA